MVAGSAPDEQMELRDEELTAEPDAALTVVVVDGQRTFAELLGHALATEPGMSCVGTAVDAEAGWTLIETKRPDLVVMDVELGEDDGIELTERVTKAFPGLRVVILTHRPDHDTLRRAAAAGACSLQGKDSSLRSLISAVRNAKLGGLSVHPDLLMSVVSAPRPDRRVPELTERELEVLVMLRDGRAVRQIARALAISEHTARGHVKRVLVKLDAHSQLEAVATATRYGLLR